MIIPPNKLSNSVINQEFFEQLIQDEVEEDLHLEYKREIGTNSGEIAKDLSAFANSDGGYIIYGIEEDNHKPKQIIPITGTGIKERLDQIAQTGIDPALNVRILPIDVNVNNNTEQVFLIYIPKKYPILHYTKKTKILFCKCKIILCQMITSKILRAE